MATGRQAQPGGRYQAYLVRLWQDRPDTPWRALAREAPGGAEHRFATIEQLFLFLHRQTAATRSGQRDDGSDRVPATGGMRPRS